MPPSALELRLHVPGGMGVGRGREDPVVRETEVHAQERQAEHDEDAGDRDGDGPRSAHDGHEQDV